MILNADGRHPLVSLAVLENGIVSDTSKNHQLYPHELQVAVTLIGGEQRFFPRAHLAAVRSP